ncbi:exodeoxyribonuclease V subunit beta [Enterobacteriaceae endosymbiont of Donacia crassipes]|uniref:exodeoxyribonuclease V subunit beta n=1 Tax=Enterobacteriaceae endosymbiont of Donacia crassipes TaxID=2675776 RepID=UPI001448D65D|nr:exodeoxyribonuclease V subunit beta [Enterobacteriaceae endosymbiont of Donacia crassipes]QJC34683.1 exodeoxyribonuclease V subunit beta [Enterobacteriaceae endosymbiont of Donacia crassipes]
MTNKLTNFKEFNPFKENLKGQFLIEASAGTGKTFNIIIIYLRMLLGLHQKNTNIKPLNVEQILVVTFTDIAIQNLYKKIKNSIYLLRIGCIQKKSKYDIINNIIREIKDYKNANILLLKAEKNINNASIYTIHSFCQKILNLKNYEIHNFLFNKKIINDELFLQRKASIIFWKTYLYDLPKEIIKIILLYWKTPDDLLKTLLPLLSQQKLPIIKYPFKNRNLCVQFYKNKKYIKNIKKYWIKYKNNIINIINNSNVNKHIYNKKFIKNWISIINKWSLIETKNYFFPKELSRFSQKILINNTINNINPPIYILFQYIDIFINKIINLKYLIITKAIKYIKKYVLQKKRNNNEISFNDLLNILNKSLNTRFGIQIIEDIRKLFPVILIDEFQDTDIQQYNILKKIYFNQNNDLMILIGDPKQAIYSFRGADIFTYLKASLEIKQCYTLTYNWRSSSTMINGINKLFSNRTYPFVFKNIIFNPIKYSSKKLNDHFIINNKIKSGITFWFIDKIMDINLYRQKISYICAYEICQLIILGEKGQAFLQKNNEKKNINISDITVIVRNRFEAIILQKEFVKFNLPFIYLSNSNNIFEKQEAKELFFLLKTILKPNKKQKIINVLSSTLFNINLSFFDENNQKNYIEKIMNKFNKYKLIWEKYGILSMLEEIFIQDKFISQINISNQFMRKKIKNILYLGEIIQTSCFDITDLKKTIVWLLQQIKYTNKNLLNQQIKLNNKINKIKIMTIHKSKGLQFPIVWLPFISSNIIEFINKDGIIYHNRKNFKITLDFIKDEESKKLFLEETLSENLRLLYVSLTRSIFHCSIGITNLKFYNFKKKNLYLSYINALNFLLKKKNNISNTDLKKILYNLKDKNISIKIFNKKKKIKLDHDIYTRLENKKLFTLPVKNFYFKNKIISSFSKIKKQQNFNLNYFSINYQYNFLNLTKNSGKKTQYNFPIGKNIGIIIHKILEKLDFTKNISRSFIKKELMETNINVTWHIMITNWFNNILNIPIGKNKIILHQINNHEKKTEFKFYLSIKKDFSSIEYNNIINKYDIISNKLNKLNFQTINGFLSGIIDLIFLWKNKFYIIDYKSSWLGNNNKDYKTKNLEKDIYLNRYDIQYQFYTLALHKYLKYRIKNYNYNKCFGGVIYFYIRGFDHKIKKYNGVWETKPSIKLIDKLNKLFL